jgi:predicted signal transduction protein with EAL and GGDEF domain
LSDPGVEGSDPDAASVAGKSAEAVAGGVRRILQEPFVVSGVQISVTASVGISLSPTDASDTADLLTHADIAMYAAQAAGRDGHRLFTLDHDTALQQLSMAGRLRRALDLRRGAGAPRPAAREARHRCDGRRGGAGGRLIQTWVSMLKIDRSFVRDLPGGDHARVLVPSIIQLAEALGLDPVAEGIETEEQRSFLIKHGCRLGEGFYYSRSVPATKIPQGYRAASTGKPRAACASRVGQANGVVREGGATLGLAR